MIFRIYLLKIKIYFVAARNNFLIFCVYFSELFKCKRELKENWVILWIKSITINWSNNIFIMICNKCEKTSAYT